MKGMKYVIIAAGAAGLMLASSFVMSGKHEDETVIEDAQSKNAVYNIKTLDQLEGIIAKNEKVAVDIGATWCGPCRRYAPVFHEVAEKYKDKAVFCKVVLDKIDEKEHSSISGKYKVMAIPYTVMFKDGKQVRAVTGSIDKDTLSNLVEEHLIGR